MNVCHLASGDLWAGAEVQLATLLAELARDDRLRLSAIFYNSGILADRVREIGIPVWVFDERKHNSLRLLHETRKILRQERIDILHTHRYKENILGGVAAKISGVKHLICTVHGMSEPFSGFRRLKASAYGFLNDLVLRLLMDSVVTVSHDIRRKLSRRLKPAKLVTIHNGIDLDRLCAGRDPRQVRDALGIGADDPVIGSVGRLTPVKGYPALLRACRLLRERRPNLRLVLVGDGPERKPLERVADQLGIREQVVFCGFHPQPAEIVAALDVFVLSSLHEGISMSLLEALALGVSVVVTDVGGNPEVVRHGETGLLVPPQDDQALADACGILLDDPELRRQLADKGKSLVQQRFSKEAMAEKVYRLYEDLFDKKR